MDEMEILKDKKEWGDGPWINEVDRLEWRYRGVPCLIVRAPVTGALCGYAGIGPDHPWYGIGYNDCAKGCAEVPQRPLEPMGDFPIPQSMQKRHMAAKRFACDDDNKIYDHSPGGLLAVHGGLTYADFCDDGGKICHVPLEGEPEKVWWFGFDCAHAWDLSPRMEAFQKTVVPELGVLLSRAHRSDVYRDVDYVTKEVQQLADQLIDVAENS